MAGPSGPAAYQEATGQDWSAKRPVSGLHRNIQVFKGGTGGSGGLCCSFPIVQYPTDEEREGSGRKSVLPD